jgi:hypothetical protein
LDRDERNGTNSPQHAHNEPIGVLEHSITVPISLHKEPLMLHSAAAAEEEFQLQKQNHSQISGITHPS